MILPARDFYAGMAQKGLALLIDNETEKAKKEMNVTIAEIK